MPGAEIEIETGTEIRIGGFVAMWRGAKGWVEQSATTRAGVAGRDGRLLRAVPGRRAEERQTAAGNGGGTAAGRWIASSSSWLRGQRGREGEKKKEEEKEEKEKEKEEEEEEEEEEVQEEVEGRRRCRSVLGD
jgi:hypothetical protein